MPMMALSPVLALVVVGLVLYLINTRIPMPETIRTLANVVLGLIVVGVLLFLINTYIPMAGSIKAILNIVVVVATCVKVLQALGLWDAVVRSWNRLRHKAQTEMEKPSPATSPDNERVVKTTRVEIINPSETTVSSSHWKSVDAMREARIVRLISFGLVLGFTSWGQSTSDQNPANPTPEAKQNHKSEPGAAREMGSGAATIGVGAAKGAGSLAKGTGKGAVELVTLHPVDAGASVGKGAAGAAKDVSVGTVKGTGKVAKGAGRAFKKLF
jgi:hypothetical protein